MEEGNVDLAQYASDSSWEDIEDELEDEDCCHALLLNELILEKIFECLSTLELLTCRRVCRVWNRTVLLRRLLGSKLEIVVTRANLDKLLKTAQSSPFPFCRRFVFQSVELEVDRVSKFIRLFGERLNSLSLKFCTASSAESVIKILNCPRLEELKIYGTLPEILEENFHSFNFTRLRVLELHSSSDYGQLGQDFIRIIWKRSPSIKSVIIGQSISLWMEFCSALEVLIAPKLCHIRLAGIEGPIEIEHFRIFFTKGQPLSKIHLQNCLVTSHFLEQFLQDLYKTLTVLIIEGTQQEILSTALRNLVLPNLKHLTLPIDGVSRSDGSHILLASPELAKLNIDGLFKTMFVFENGTLMTVTMGERSLSTLFSRETLQQTVIQEKRREFLKVLSLLPLQPQRLEINLLVSHINSRCLRAIYTQYPDLENLLLSSTSAKQCVVGLTGIPYRTCRKITACKTFSVLHADKVRLFPSLSALQKLKELEISVFDETPSAELTLLLILYGISELGNLQKLVLNGFTLTDVAFMILGQKLNLSACYINGSEDQWNQFQVNYKKHTIKSFLLPPGVEKHFMHVSAAEFVGNDRKILQNIFSCLDVNDIFEARKVCNYWHAVASQCIHKSCGVAAGVCPSPTTNLEKRLHQYQKQKVCPTSPRNHNLYYLGESPMPALSRVIQIWSSMKTETLLVIASLSKPAMEFLQLDNCRSVKQRHGGVTCRQRCELEYWFYPDGSDELIYPPVGNIKSGVTNSILSEVRTLLVIGSWGRKDNALLEFLNPNWSVSGIHLVGLQKETLDFVFPKLTSMMNLESLQIKPWLNASSYLELTRTHLQILCNASFKLRQLTMRSHAPSEAVVDFVRSQRFTLEALELQSNVNVSDRLTFSMPQLKILQLDEPPGCLLWSTLNVHSTLEVINFGRSGGTYNQVKNKSSPKASPMDSDFEHSATEILCDVSWFLESAAHYRRTGVQKSILQQGSDSALKFFTHFPFLSSLTLRSVHAHYGILQGIFKKFGQLKKLELINATGVTDEILTGFSREILDDLDIMNPFQVSRDRHKTEGQRKGSASIRNLKCLTHLSLDDQPLCTDFSVIFGLLRLHQLEYLSCRKWKITDIALRALADILPSLEKVDTDDCATVSKYALEYFKETRTRRPLYQKCSLAD